MSNWPRYPTIYEINTWVWLCEVTARHGRTVDLSSVPPAEWDAIAAQGFDAVWLMGVWERSPAGTAIANRNPHLLEDFRHALPDFRPEDNVGSPYSVRQYTTDPHLGGPQGLARARQELASRGMKLILDFVPNHLAPDHPWVRAHPEYFIGLTPDDLTNDAASCLHVEGNIYAFGRDPYFPAWPDVLQLNAFDPGLRRAVIETLSGIAGQSDGVRCDMAMLLLNSIFERTWGSRIGPPPPTEYWQDVISAVKLAYPDFLFIAEVYWDLEWELQQQGFDFCYDKRLYDRLAKDTAESVRLHLTADLPYQAKLLRFLENHDEPRAASAFPPGREQAAAVVTYSLPGARLFYEGQFEGRKIRLPVFLGRCPDEPIDKDIQAFYGKLLNAINTPVFRNGDWSLRDRSGWPENASYQNLVAWTWHSDHESYIVVVNLSDHPAQAKVSVGWPELAGKQYLLTDAFSGAEYERDGDELLHSGLYVDLLPWGYHFLRCGSRSP
jgi:hypothetical protein